jgi:hypothetical protein
MNIKLSLKFLTSFLKTLNLYTILIQSVKNKTILKPKNFKYLIESRNWSEGNLLKSEILKISLDKSYLVQE